MAFIVSRFTGPEPGEIGNIVRNAIKKSYYQTNNNFRIDFTSDAASEKTTTKTTFQHTILKSTAHMVLIANNIESIDSPYHLAVSIGLL